MVSIRRSKSVTRWVVLNKRKFIPELLQSRQKILVVRGNEGELEDSNRTRDFNSHFARLFRKQATHLISYDSTSVIQCILNNASLTITFSCAAARVTTIVHFDRKPVHDHDQDMNTRTCFPRRMRDHVPTPPCFLRVSLYREMHLFAPIISHRR